MRPRQWQRRDAQQSGPANVPGPPASRVEQVMERGSDKCALCDALMCFSVKEVGLRDQQPFPLLKAQAGDPWLQSCICAAELQ